MNEDERDALLLRLDDRTLRADRELFGNGRPGLISTVAAAVSRIEAMEHETELIRQPALDRLAKAEQLIEDIDRRAPSDKEKRAGWATIGVALVVAIGGVAVEWLKR